MRSSETTGTLGIAEVIGDKREEVLALAAQHGAYNVRIFGSVARREASLESDVDFLVDFHAGATMWDAVALWRKLRGLLGREVNIVAEETPQDRFMQSALEDAVVL